MLDVYKKVQAKYPMYAIGYVDNDLFVQLSVVNKKAKQKNRAAIRTLELNQTMQYYANQWVDMIRELNTA